MSVYRAMHARPSYLSAFVSLTDDFYTRQNHCRNAILVDVLPPKTLGHFPQETIANKLASHFGGFPTDFHVAKYNERDFVIFLPEWVPSEQLLGREILSLDELRLQCYLWSPWSGARRAQLTYNVWIRLVSLPYECWSSRTVAALVGGFGRFIRADDFSAHMVDLTGYRCLISVNYLSDIPENLEITVGDLSRSVLIQLERWGRRDFVAPGNPPNERTDQHEPQQSGAEDQRRSGGSVRGRRSSAGGFSSSDAFWNSSEIWDRHRATSPPGGPTRLKTSSASDVLYERHDGKKITVAPAIVGKKLGFSPAIIGRTGRSSGSIRLKTSSASDVLYERHDGKKLTVVPAIVGKKLRRRPTLQVTYGNILPLVGLLTYQGVIESPGAWPWKSHPERLAEGGYCIYFSTWEKRRNIYSLILLSSSSSRPGILICKQWAFPCCLSEADRVGATQVSRVPGRTGGKWLNGSCLGPATGSLQGPINCNLNVAAVWGPFGTKVHLGHPGAFKIMVPPCARKLLGPTLYLLGPFGGPKLQGTTLVFQAPTGDLKWHDVRFYFLAPTGTLKFQGLIEGGESPGLFETAVGAPTSDRPRDRGPQPPHQMDRGDGSKSSEMIGGVSSGPGLTGLDQQGGGVGAAHRVGGDGNGLVHAGGGDGPDYTTTSVGASIESTGDDQLTPSKAPHLVGEDGFAMGEQKGPTRSSVRLISSAKVPVLERAKRRKTFLPEGEINSSRTLARKWNNKKVALKSARCGVKLTENEANELHKFLLLG
uniref:Uncharacterized protein n=1 Tax=Ananas comosus var. bracteatus TaxID=296719 RepID=A0A6V7PF38_ANACO|nr:unnamed protein product [Ananas comosus var. bracteatus]